MQLLFSTVIRTAPLHASRELVSLDWASKRLLARRPIKPLTIRQDSNGRGNSRGGRGIAIVGKRIVVAAYDALMLFDRDLLPIGAISHGLMAGLHEITQTGDSNILVSSTAIDAVIEYNLDSGTPIREFWPRDVPSFQTSLGLCTSEVDRHLDNRARYLQLNSNKRPSHLHLNAVAKYKGDTYALFNRYGTIVNLTTNELCVRDPDLVGAHNLVFIPDGKVIVAATRKRSLRVYDIHTARLCANIDLLKFRPIRWLARRHTAARAAARWRIQRAGRLVPGLRVRSRYDSAAPLFVRGCHVHENRLFVGMSPASIACLDITTWKLIDFFQYSTDVRTAIHGLHVMAGRGDLSQTSTVSSAQHTAHSH